MHQHLGTQSKLEFQVLTKILLFSPKYRVGNNGSSLSFYKFSLETFLLVKLGQEQLARTFSYQNFIDLRN